MRTKFLIFFAMILLLLIALCSCTGPCMDGCEAGVYQRTVESTCSQAGYELYVCPKCNHEVERVALPLLEHTPAEEWKRVHNPSCIGEGVETINCTVCDAAVERRTIPALGHNYAWTVKIAAGCTTLGLKSGKCTNGSCTYTTEEDIPALGHSWQEVELLAPTCTTYGHKAGTQCSRIYCNAWQEGGEQIAKLPHTPYDVEAIAATCTASGKTAGTSCSVCWGVISGQSTIPALGHDFDVFTNTCRVCPTKQIAAIVDSHNEFTSSFNYENPNTLQSAVIELDKCIDVSTGCWLVIVKSNMKHLRLVGTTGVEYKVSLQIQDRSDPLTIDLVNTTLVHVDGYSNIDSPTSVDLYVNFYGTKCGLYGATGKAGTNGSNSIGGTRKGGNGGNGGSGIKTGGDLIISIAANSVTIKGGDGGNGGSGANAMARNGANGGNGGNGAQGIVASSITVKTQSGYSKSNLSILGSQGGTGGAGGKGDGLLYGAGSAGKAGSAASATNVSVTYQ